MSFRFNKCGFVLIGRIVTYVFYRIKRRSNIILSFVSERDDCLKNNFLESIIILYAYFYSLR